LRHLASNLVLDCAFGHSASAELSQDVDTSPRNRATLRVVLQANPHLTDSRSNLARSAWHRVTGRLLKANSVRHAGLGHHVLIPAAFCINHGNESEIQMNKDQVKGVVQEVKGKAKETAGKVTGDKDLETSGDIDQVAGKVRKAVGDVREAVKHPK
jgi:uncharacterized protein YjbJ (UPF0337 family)